MRAIADGLFTEEDPPSLIGGRDRESGRIVFPCPEGPRFDAVPLSRSGTLWSYTVQRFRPKSPPYEGPEYFEPWALGYVELPGETMVEARLTNVEFTAIKIGMKLSLIKMALNPAADDLRAIPAFEPERNEG